MRVILGLLIKRQFKRVVLGLLVFSLHGLAFAGGQDAEGEGLIKQRNGEGLVVDLYEIPFNLLEGGETQLGFASFSSFEIVSGKRCEQDGETRFYVFSEGLGLLDSYPSAIAFVSSYDVALFRRAPEAHRSCFKQLSYPMLANEFYRHLAKVAKYFVARTDLLVEQGEVTIAKLADNRDKVEFKDLVAVSRELHRLVANYLSELYGFQAAASLARLVNGVSQRHRALVELLIEMDQPIDTLDHFPERQFLHISDRASLSQDALEQYLEFDELLVQQKIIEAYSKESPKYKKAGQELRRIWKDYGYNYYHKVHWKPACWERYCWPSLLEGTLDSLEGVYSEIESSLR